MAANALNIYSAAETKDKLAELYGNLIEGIQKGAISEQIKNKDYSGDPTTGSVKVDRFKNAVAANYGTARTAGKGDALMNNGKVTIDIDTDKEIVEEIEEKDVRLFGIANIIARRVDNHVKRMVANLDSAFFAAAESAATAVELGADITAPEDIAEALIQSIETVKNDWVDGVDRDDIVLTLSPALYGKLRNKLDMVTLPTADAGAKEIPMFHGVRIFSNVRQTADAIVMVNGAVAQPVLVNEYQDEKINLSNAHGVELFYSYGTKAVAADLIKKLTLGGESS